MVGSADDHGIEVGAGKNFAEVPVDVAPLVAAGSLLGSISILNLLLR